MGKGNKQRGNREAKKPKADKKVAPVSSTFLRPQVEAPKQGASRRQNSRCGKRNSTCEFRRRNGRCDATDTSYHGRRLPRTRHGCLHAAVCTTSATPTPLLHIGKSPVEAAVGHRRKPPAKSIVESAVLSSVRFDRRDARGKRHRCGAVLSRVFAGKHALRPERPRSLRTNGSCFGQSCRSAHSSCPPARRRTDPSPRQSHTPDNIGALLTGPPV